MPLTYLKYVAKVYSLLVHYFNQQHQTENNPKVYDYIQCINTLSKGSPKYKSLYILLW